MKYTNFILLVFFMLPGYVIAGESLKSPSDYLGYTLGSRFSYHHKVVEYCNYLASNSNVIALQNYGQTYEHRDLVLAFVSSEENLNNLDQIRENNLRRAGLSTGQPVENDIAIIWLSFNVHGNEASSTETAMKLLYELANNSTSKYRSWLEKLVIIIDPCLNPDGRVRYVTWYNQVSGMVPNPNVDTREHREGWAHGRSNHYLFDLNRDWLWQTQNESIQRLNVYNAWLPHVHVDFHEQGYNDKYYFPPAAQPFHEIITPWQREFQEIIGRNNAKYFDKEGWLYFTRERFDLLYPGYGDTYPTYNGAVGMTYEMAGHSLAGLSVKTEKGDTLKLSDRIAMHFTAALATIETTFENNQKLIAAFRNFFKPAAKEMFIMKSNQADKLTSLADLLDKNSIRYHGLEESVSIKAYSYEADKIISLKAGPGDMVISLDQPKSKLVQVLFEKKTRLVDSLTYDITAWSLPYVYGLDAYQTSEKLALTEFQITPDKLSQTIKDPYAYVLNWSGTKDAAFLAEMLTLGVKVNYSSEDFDLNGQKFSHGSLVITRIDNKHIADFHKKITGLAEIHQRELVPLAGGAGITSFNLGSAKIRYLKKPRIALLAGEGISTLGFGELWYFLEQEIKMQVDILDVGKFSDEHLEKYDILLLASGSYGSLTSEGGIELIDAWVQAGGKLILLEDAIAGFSGEGKFGLKAKDEVDSLDKEPVLHPYTDDERENIRNYILGGVLKMKIDNTHPLAYGYDKEYYTLKTNTKNYGFLAKGWNVGYFESDIKVVSGFVGSGLEEKLAKNLIFGVEERGRGRVVYFVDDPMFRSFWQNGKLFMANALFFDN